MLQGQIGGLNLPPGTQQSPAMPMLTRPMVPPSQQGPTTPQQRPQAHVPQMTPQGQDQLNPAIATQLMREAQQRAAQAAQNGQPLTDQVRMGLIPHDLDPHVKAQLMKVPENQFRGILQNYMANVRRNNANAIQNGGFLGGQPGPGQPNMMNPGLQMNMPNQMMNAANIANLPRGPGMNMGQQMNNGMGGPQMQMGPRPQMLPPQQRLAAAQQLLQQNPGIIAGTDNTPFPQNVLNAQIKQSLPPEVKTWAQLKQWANQNPALMPGVDAHKLLLLQVLHFQDLIRQRNEQQRLQQNGMVNVRPPQANNAAGVAPPAQMTPNPMSARAPPQQPNVQGMGPVQVSPQEIQVARSRLPPHQATATDEQIRAFLMKQKLNQRQQMANQQAQHRNQGLQQQPPMAGQPPQISRPPTTQAQPTQAAPQPKSAGKPQQSSQPAQPSVQNNLTKGVKRPNEDAAEASADAVAPNVAPPAPMVNSKSQQGLNLTQEQMSKLTPAQQAQMRAQLLKAQDASNNKSQPRALPSQEELQARMRDPAREKKFRLMLNEEPEKTNRTQPVQVPPEIRAQLQTVIRQNFERIKKVEQALRIFLAGYEGSDSEGVARTVIKARNLLLKQLNPQDGTLHADLTMTADEFRQNIRHILSFVGKVMSKMQNQQQGQNVPTQQNQAPQQAPQAQPATASQLNAANLKIHEQQQRQQKAPQAPTTERPPGFPLGGQSPRGAPIYLEGARTVTNLKLPDKKRAKMDPNSQTPTPGVTASPRIPSGKSTSPELKRQAPPEKPVPQKPTFKCKTADCEYAVRGFDTQAELEAHISQTHARIDDPLQFALESMADVLDVDPKTGLPKTDTTAANRAAKPAPAAPRVPAPAQPVKSGQTPSIPQNVTTPAGTQAVATPMARIPTQPGIKSSPSTNLLKTPQTVAKVATPSTGAPAKATPASTTKPVTKGPEVVAVPQPEKEEDLQPLVPSSLFDFSYEDTFAALDANAPFTVLDLKDEDNSWALRSRPSSPINTPDSSSKDTPSTRQSDISENDNLQINLNVKDVDMPDAWMTVLNGDPLPLDTQLSEDLQTLGVGLPPMDSDDMMLFYGDSMMMDLDTLDKTMDSLGGTLDPSILAAAN